MEFNEKSWHVRLNKYFKYDLKRESCRYEHETVKYVHDQVSLCKYFWITAFNIIVKATPLGFCMVAGTLFVLNGIYVFVAGLFALFMEIPASQDVYDAGLVFWVILLVGGISITLALLFDSRCREEMGVWPNYFPVDKWLASLGNKIPKYQPKSSSRPTVEKEHSLFSQYIKARKQKFCPYVSVSEEQD